MIALGNLLGLIFLLWLPILISIYFFKSRPVRHKVSSLFLWKKVYQKRRNQGFFEKFKNNLIFWLQLFFFFLLFMALSRPSLRGQERNKKQIYIIDNSGSMIASSGLFKTRLNSSLELVRKHVKTLKNKNCEVYEWNSSLKRISIGGNLEVKLSRVKPTHLPNGDFFYLISSIKDFIKEDYEVALFTDSLEYEEQFNLANLGVEVFLSAHDYRNVYFESIDGDLLNDGKLKFTINVACTSIGGSGALVVSQKGVLQQRLTFKLKEDDNIQFDLEVEPASLSESIRFELFPDEPDVLVEDNLIEYFIDSRIPKIAVLGFSDSDLFSKLFKAFLYSDKRFQLVDKKFQIQFVKVSELPRSPRPRSVYIMDGKGEFENFEESKSHILEWGHPLTRFVSGNKFSVAKDFPLIAEDDKWDSLIQIEQVSSNKSTPGLLIHKRLPACILINLALSSYSISNADFPILLENILRYMLREFRMNSIVEVGSGAIRDTESTLSRNSQDTGDSRITATDLQGAYKRSNGSNYYARFPVIESRLKEVNRNPVVVTVKPSVKGGVDLSENMKIENSKLTGLLILLAIIIMVYEWYVFSRRA